MKALGDWLEAIVVVAFHVEHGQVIEDVYSLNSTLSEGAKRKLCSLSLPDSNSGQNGDVLFTFRYRNNAAPLETCHPLEEDYSYGSAFFRQIKDATLKRGYFQKSVVLVSSNPCISFLEECSYIVGPLFFEFGKHVLEAILQNIKTWPVPVPGGTFRLPIAGCVMTITVPRVYEEAVEAPPFLDVDGLEEGDSRGENKVHSPQPRPRRSFVYESSGGGYLLQKQELAHYPSNSDLSSDSSETSAGLVEGSTDTEGAMRLSDLERMTRSVRGSLDDAAEGIPSLPSVVTEDVDAVPGLFQEVQLFSTFGGLSVALWHLWELALAGEPILVLAPTPDRCSQAVLAIAGLIAPIRYCGDFRPYFTIYDSDFMEISRKHDQQRGQNMLPCVLGVTNPYFLKSLEYWPNVISMGGAGPSTTALARSLTPPPRSAPQSSDLEAIGEADEEDDTESDSTVSRKQTSFGPGFAPPLRRSSRSRSSNLAFERVITSKRRSCGVNPSLNVLGRAESLSVEGRDIKTSSYKPTVAKRGESLRALLTDQKYERSLILTRDEPLVSPNKALLRQLLNEHDAVKTGHLIAGQASVAEPPALAINNALLRRHFQRLTRAFLKPLENYLRLEAVGSRAAREQGISLSAYEQPRDLLREDFEEDHFLSVLESNVPRELARSDYRQLYIKFIRGPNFGPWLARQRARLRQQLQGITRHLRIHTDPDILLQAAGAPAYMRRRILEEQAAGITSPPAESPPPPLTGAGHPHSRQKAATVFARIKHALDLEMAKCESDRDLVLVAKIQEHLEVVTTLLQS